MLVDVQEKNYTASYDVIPSDPFPVLIFSSILNDPWWLHGQRNFCFSKMRNANFFLKGRVCAAEFKGPLDSNSIYFMDFFVKWCHQSRSK